MLTTFNSTGCVFPTIGNTFPSNGSEGIAQTFIAGKTAKGHITAGNVAVFALDWNSSANGDTAIQAALAQVGYGNNLRA